MIYSTFGFLIFVKLLFFWLWLWQLKEYHTGRFLTHFKEGQAIKKILSSFWRFKYPKFTKKIIVISLVSVFLAILMFSKELYLSTFLLIIFIPLIFQIPTLIWRNRFLEKARKKREQFKDLIVIGITGSYGKTSTKEFLATILSEKFNVLKTKEHQNSEVGISQCILDELSSSHEVFVVEMGAYNRGGIKLLCHIVQPKIGVLTGINEQHMALFGSQKNIIKTKFELIESLPNNGIAFFNEKNKYCLDLYHQTKVKKILYGQEATFSGEENILGAMAVAKELGMSQDEITKACQKMENRTSIYGSEGEDEGKALIAYKFPGIEFKKGKNGLNIIDATYSANSDGVIAHLDYLKTWKGKKVIIMSCLIELGKASKEVHQRIGQKIGQVCDLAIITTKDRFKEIKDGSASLPQGGAEVLLIEDSKEIFEKIKDFNKENDIILLESRVPKLLIERLK